jgi:phosphoribosylanthranilate isomerase
MTKVKICGIRCLQDLQAAYGADALGFVVGSPGATGELPLEIVKILLPQLPLFCSAVLVTSLTDPIKLGWLASEVEPHALQLNIEVSSMAIKRVRQALPTKVKLYSLFYVQGEAEPLLKRAASLAKSGLDGLILDTKARMDETDASQEEPHWPLYRQVRDAIWPVPAIVGGQISNQNLSDVLRYVEPYAIDLSCGLEEGEFKSRDKILELIRRIKNHGHESSD